ncbi:NUDIX hydrolase [Streptomyces sp. KM273126]|uniref:NUDIX hydrolase n=1 Tax=Streptomyces sp. KM273126 TaxID=2545247 RepID=UPI0010392EE2|nr:NUDIX hydrolase [Streptomyces sp. KM273126]MBA2809288.1 NUDIX hydrolase [Streptomyces sp. KM273126]
MTGGVRRMRDLHSLDELQEWLRSNGIPCESWGIGAVKSVRNLWDEITSGEATLSDDPPLRHVSVVSVRIGQDGKQLTEVGQLMAGGAERKRNSPPTEKMKPGETVVAAVLRCLAEELGVRERDVTIDPLSLSVAVEKVVSPSYPGLPSEYRLHTVDAQVSGLPGTSFTTEEASGCWDAVISRHFWEWR